jgi:ankyrin repeat protein
MISVSLNSERFISIFFFISWLIFSEFGEAEKANSGINLFVWAILFNRVEIAKILIQHGEVCLNKKI